MITEDYVSFETAKLLKEKGFNEKCFALYNPDGVLIQSGIKLNNIQVGRVEGSYSAPTLQMAMKWLREVHNQNIVLDMIPNGDDCYSLWTFNVISNRNYKIVWGTKQPKYNTYEQACDEGIKYCLENLI